MVLIDKKGEIVKYLILLLLLVGCNRHSLKEGESTNREIYERCLNTETDVGVGPSIGDDMGVAVTINDICTDKEKIIVKIQKELGAVKVKKIMYQRTGQEIKTLLIK